MSIANEPGREARVDVLVAGAGPAGSIAALELARAGHSVLLADRLRPAAPKIGETLPGAAIRLLRQLGLDPAMPPVGEGWHRPVIGALTAWEGAAMVPSDAIADPYGPGLRLDRRRFDAMLRGAALNAGASHRRADISCLARSGHGWSLGLDDGGRITASWLVDATGRNGKLARLIGVRRRRQRPLVAIYRHGRPTLNAAMDRTIVEAGPDGWFYAGHLGKGRWAIAFHTSPGQAALLRREPERWEAAAEGAPGLATLLGRLLFDAAPVFRDARGGGLASSVGEGWVACGDAALSFDPIAGQGLFNALRSGMAAARHVAAAIAGRGGTGYAEEIARVAAIYAERRRALYAAQRRWPESAFWRGQRDE